jgi:hypothetical protein
VVTRKTLWKGPEETTRLTSQSLRIFALHGETAKPGHMFSGLSGTSVLTLLVALSGTTLGARLASSAFAIPPGDATYDYVGKSDLWPVGVSSRSSIESSQVHAVLLGLPANKRSNQSSEAVRRVSLSRLD